MNDENWKEEFKEWNPNLKPYQIKLLDEGAKSNSQTLMLSDMWLKWKGLAVQRKLNEIDNNQIGLDPWDDRSSEIPQPCKGLTPLEIDEELLKKVKSL
ncbi:MULTISPECIES: hypothetical protein [Prochlorococcus]|uniref:hypothetical protein n=1 Tax=Prochlorococcus TaxID=1218 RepID=UPI0005338102|nr:MULTISPECIES: hypothetical protein [Prochlorococcus]KGG12774.1 putative protein family PM-7 [Prochlorococcus sp. MIT 0601]